MCLGKFNSCDRRIKVYGFCCIVETGHKKIIGDRKSGILRSKTDACGNIVISADKSFRKEFAFLKNSESLESCFYFIVRFIYTLRFKSDSIFFKCIFVCEKTLMIFLISNNAADIIELCASVFGDQMLHQSADRAVVVNS